LERPGVLIQSCSGGSILSRSMFKYTASGAEVFSKTQCLGYVDFQPDVGKIDAI
jgi:hypothetical protein